MIDSVNEFRFGGLHLCARSGAPQHRLEIEFRSWRQSETSEIMKLAYMVSLAQPQALELPTTSLRYCFYWGDGVETDRMKLARTKDGFGVAASLWRHKFACGESVSREPSVRTTRRRIAMNARIFSQFLDHCDGRLRFKQATLIKRVALTVATGALSSLALCTPSVAQDNSNGYFTDPATGIVYRKVAKTIERPVIETKVQSRNQTIYRPQTVTETKPEARTVYQPVVEYKWEPRLHGRWNPFQRPTVAYHHVPETKMGSSK